MYWMQAFMSISAGLAVIGLTIGILRRNCVKALSKAKTRKLMAKSGSGVMTVAGTLNRSTANGN